MNTFFPLLKLGIRRRSRDFFIIFYTVVFPIVIIALLGYLTSTSYGTEFTSYEYYSIVIIPFCLLMGVTSVVYAAADEKDENSIPLYDSSYIKSCSDMVKILFLCHSLYDMWRDCIIAFKVIISLTGRK